jgi:hypothetical protein
MAQWWAQSTAEKADFGRISEAAMLGALEYWEIHPECGFEVKRNTQFVDIYRYGASFALLPTLFGNLAALLKWCKLAVAAYKGLDLRKTRAYATEALEIHHCRDIAPLLCCGFGRQAEAHALLESMGFVWSEAGFAQYDLWFEAFAAAMPGMQKEGDAVYQRMIMYLASPSSAALDAEVSAWIPAPAALAEIERTNLWNHNIPFNGILHIGAEVFMKLGRHSDAAEAASIAVSPEQHTHDLITLMGCYSVLGKVAAECGEFLEAECHFGRALEAAEASHQPMLEVVTAQQWKRAVGKSKSGAAGADAVIEAACAKMGKSLEELDSGLLLGGGGSSHPASS